MSIWVSNTSPLIFLARLQRLEILQKLAGTIVIPRFVLSEISAKEDAAAKSIQDACQEWITVQDVEESSVATAMADLHRGEAEAIVLAQTLKADYLLVDDQDAREFASRSGIKIIGTLGLLMAAKRNCRKPERSKAPMQKRT